MSHRVIADVALRNRRCLDPLSLMSHMTDDINFTIIFNFPLKTIFNYRLPYRSPLFLFVEKNGFLGLKRKPTAGRIALPGIEGAYAPSKGFLT
jgi:hypothetical protein